MATGRPLIEVCVDSLESARAATEGGANRLEVCSSLAVGGGLTPSYGLVHLIRKEYPHFPVMVMIRPRMGDFLYTDAEMSVMKADIRLFSELDVTGFVIGVLDASGRIDKLRLEELITTIHQHPGERREITFHRAFDMTPDAVEAFQDLAEMDITRILTSGHAPDVSSESAIVTISRLLRIRGSGPSTRGPQILVGSGIKPHTIERIARALWPKGIEQYHLSAGVFIDGGVDPRARKIGLGMGVGPSEWGRLVTSQEAVREVKAGLQRVVLELQE